MTTSTREEIEKCPFCRSTPRLSEAEWRDDRRYFGMDIECCSTMVIGIGWRHVKDMSVSEREAELMKLVESQWNVPLREARADLIEATIAEQEEQIRMLKAAVRHEADCVDAASEKIAEQAAELELLRKEDWISVEDRLPELGQQVLTTVLMTNNQFTHTGISFRFYDTSIGKDGQRGGEKWAGDHTKPTYWKPEPAAPKQRKF